MRRIVLGSVALLWVLALAGCGGDSSDAKGSDTSSTTTTPISITTTTGSGPPTTAAEPSTTQTLVPASNAEQYSEVLIDAWEHGDRDKAAVLAEAAAVQTLFAYEPAEDGTAPTWKLQTCEGAAGSSYCTFGAGGDATIVVRVDNERASTGLPVAVSEVEVKPTGG